MGSGASTRDAITTSEWLAGNMARISTISPTKRKRLTSRASLAPNEGHRASVLAVGINTSPREEIGHAALAGSRDTVISWVRSICIGWLLVHQSSFLVPSRIYALAELGG